MKRLRAFQQTATLAETDTSAEVTFPTIPGSIVGYSTLVTGTIPPGESCKAVLKDGGQNISDPIDIRVSEVTTKNSFQGAIIPLQVPAPGQITAVFTPSAIIGSSEDYKVEVIIWYADGVRNQVVSIKDCL